MLFDRPHRSKFFNNTSLTSAAVPQSQNKHFKAPSHTKQLQEENLSEMFPFTLPFSRSDEDLYQNFLCSGMTESSNRQFKAPGNSFFKSPFSPHSSNSSHNSSFSNFSPSPHLPSSHTVSYNSGASGCSGFSVNSSISSGSSNSLNGDPWTNNHPSSNDNSPVKSYQLSLDRLPPDHSFKFHPPPPSHGNPQHPVSSLSNRELHHQSYGREFVSNGSLEGFEPASNSPWSAVGAGSGPGVPAVVYDGFMYSQHESEGTRLPEDDPNRDQPNWDQNSNLNPNNFSGFKASTPAPVSLEHPSQSRVGGIANGSAIGAQGVVSNCNLEDSPNPNSRQIYLTFPADSSFNEEEVAQYFNTHYGPVQEVRIPFQQKRMYGFVTFIHPQTVKQILAEAGYQHPHYDAPASGAAVPGACNAHLIAGARVLVKPYREKIRKGAAGGAGGAGGSIQQASSQQHMHHSNFSHALHQQQHYSNASGPPSQLLPLPPHFAPGSLFPPGPPHPYALLRDRKLPSLPAPGALPGISASGHPAQEWAPAARGPRNPIIRGGGIPHSPEYAPGRTDSVFPAAISHPRSQPAHPFGPPIALEYVEEREGGGEIWRFERDAARFQPKQHQQFSSVNHDDLEYELWLNRRGDYSPASSDFGRSLEPLPAYRGSCTNQFLEAFDARAHITRALEENGLLPDHSSSFLPPSPFDFSSSLSDRLQRDTGPFSRGPRIEKTGVDVCAGGTSEEKQGGKACAFPPLPEQSLGSGKKAGSNPTLNGSVSLGSLPEFPNKESEMTLSTLSVGESFLKGSFSLPSLTENKGRSEGEGVRGERSLYPASAETQREGSHFKGKLTNEEPKSANEADSKVEKSNNASSGCTTAGSTAQSSDEENRTRGVMPLAFSSAPLLSSSLALNEFTVPADCATCFNRVNSEVTLPDSPFGPCLSGVSLFHSGDAFSLELQPAPHSPQNSNSSSAPVSDSDAHSISLNSLSLKASEREVITSEKICDAARTGLPFSFSPSLLPPSSHTWAREWQMFPSPLILTSSPPPPRVSPSLSPSRSHPNSAGFGSTSACGSSARPPSVPPFLSVSPELSSASPARVRYERTGGNLSPAPPHPLAHSQYGVGGSNRIW